MTCIDIHSQSEYDQHKDDKDACLHVAGSAHVVAGGSAHVVARDSAHVVARDSAHVEATKCVAVHKQPRFTGRIAGGVIIDVPDMTEATPAGWADFTGTTARDGHMTVYKAVDGDLNSGHGMAYPPGGTVTAPDWNGLRQCGGGLHFSPHPLMAGAYLDAPVKRYLACRVALADVVALDTSKIKARACEVLHEVDASGKPLAQAAEAAS